MSRANGFLDPLIDSSDATDVRSTLNADAEILPVLIGSVTRSSLELASGSTECLQCGLGRVKVVF